VGKAAAARGGAFLRAAASIAFTLVGLAALTFFIGRLLPLDPLIAVLGENATQASYDKMALQLGLDKPLWHQFIIYVKHVAMLDFGPALTTGKPVLEDLRRVFPATMELATVAILIGAAVGIPLGVYAAMYRDSRLDYGIRIVSLIGYSAPNFWLGLMGLLVFYATLGWVGGPGRLDLMYEFDIKPVSGFYLVDAAISRNWQLFANAFSHIVLPASILGFGASAYICRMTRSFMLEQLGQEYIVTARVKGLSWTRTVWVHGLRNCLVQIITVVALSFGFLLEGAVLTETVFAWPGMGRYLTNALLAGDMNAVIGCTLLIGCTFIIINFICDLLYRTLDPRTHQEAT
jgi:peptide/nickel transport system permease protein